MIAHRGPLAPDSPESTVTRARSRFSARATYIASYAVTAVRSSQARSSRGGVANQPSRFQTSKARRALTEGIEPVRCERCPPRSCRQESSCRASSSAVHHETTAVTRAGSHADVGQSGDGVECGHGSSSDMGACCGPTLRAGLSRRGQIDPHGRGLACGQAKRQPPTSVSAIALCQGCRWETSSRAWTLLPRSCARRAAS